MSTTKNLIALAVVGKRNITRISAPREMSSDQLDLFARTVATKKNASKSYYVVEILGGKLPRKGEVLYTWHVGDGMSHADGWWVEG